MNFKLWKIGIAVAFFCALADALGVYLAAETFIVGKVIAFAVIKGIGGAALYMKQHPAEQLRFDIDPPAGNPLSRNQQPTSKDEAGDRTLTQPLARPDEETPE